jgi:DNA (cytosine-5)-methyltransferase 1
VNYYNENDPKAAAWLRELIAAGHIPHGIVDERSIADVRKSDLDGYTQFHTFCGIGGWPYALKLAGWPEDQPVWTGSCPCQPFSQSGKGLVDADERHLWPAFRTAIAECRPPIIFGEQTAGKDGRIWLAGVRADLEALGYGVGAADLCAASVGAPHIRQRLYWMAYTRSSRPFGTRTGPQRERREALGSSVSGSDGRAAHTARGGLGINGSTPGGCGHTDFRGEVERLGDAADSRSQGRGLRSGGDTGQLSPWSSGFEVVQCTDGKARRFESGSFPLADGVPARVGRLRGYGNAIVPQVAAEFIRAAMDVLRFDLK